MTSGQFSFGRRWHRGRIDRMQGKFNLTLFRPVGGGGRGADSARGDFGR